MSSVKFSSNNPIEEDNDLIDFDYLFQIIIKRKFSILLITTITLLASIIYAFTAKKIWRGQFQIVIAQNSSAINDVQATLREATPGLAKLVGMSSASSKPLLTQVEILKSPSVLMPVFNYVKNQNETDEVSKKDWTFENWMATKLNIDVKKGTSVLNVSYKDKNKDLILDVLKRISMRYQIYSGKDRKEGINDGLIYLEDQIEKYKKQSLFSQKEALSFAIENDLLQNLDESTKTYNGELIRINSLNNIRKLKDLFNRLKELENDKESFYNLSLNIQEIKESNIVSEINSLNRSIFVEKTLFTASDVDLINKIKRKDILLSLLQEKTYDFIKTKIIEEETTIESTKRPKEVLIAYKTLITNSLRDQKTLASLESDYRFLSLEKSKVKKPWELITIATILEKPASLSKRKIATYGLIGGLFLSICLILFLEKRKNLILTTKEIENILNLKIICSFNDPSDFQNQKLNLLLDMKFKLGIEEKLALIKTSNVPKDYFEILLENMQTAIQKEQILITDNLLKAKKCSKQLIITSLNSLNKNELRNLNENLILQGNESMGILLFGKDII